MEAIREPKLVITYEGKDITTDLAPSLLSVTYTDKQHGESDELEIQLEDTDGLWRGEWYPGKGDKINIQLGYRGDAELVDCGTFEVDEIELQGPPDTVNIKALATGIKSSLRTKKSSSYEGQTVKKIAETIARKNNLEVVDKTDVIVTSTTYSTRGMVEVLAAIDKRVRAYVGQYSEWSLDDAAVSEFHYRGLVKGILPEVYAEVVKLENGALGSNLRAAASQLKFFRMKIKGWIDQGSGWKQDANGISSNDYSREAKGIYENINGDTNHISTTLKTSAQTIVTGTSTKLATTVVGRVTQHRETDLEFLKRISEEYGFVFSIRDNKLIFVSIFDLEKGQPVKSLDRGDLMQYSFKDKTSQSFKAAVVKYHNPVDKQLVKYEVKELTNADGVKYKEITKDDTLVIHTKTENKQQAESKAKAAIYRANSQLQEGSVTVEGNPVLCAGNNLELTGMGVISGKFQITQSTHKVDRGNGYTTELKLKRVGYIDKGKFRTQTNKQPGGYSVG